MSFPNFSLSEEADFPKKQKKKFRSIGGPHKLPELNFEFQSWLVFQAWEKRFKSMCKSSTLGKTQS